MPNVTAQLKVALVDRYVIERELGEGGMATVYLAQDVKHDRKVALKVLRPELAAVIGADRFLQEIKVTANLQHPHILPLHDSGAAESFLYYVMPFVDGESLRDKLDREKQLGIDEAVKICESVATAVDYAHRQKVIHRDIKPENILLHDGQALVADFGIALAVSQAGGSRMTETGLSIGTPHYMSPEQAMGDRELDARSDVYSLGAMLYEMLAGDPPYQGSTAQAIVAKVITEKAPPVTAARDTVPSHVAAAITKALSKLPADRFHSAAEFASALSNPAFALPTATPTEVGAGVVPAPAAAWRRFAWPGAAAALLAGLLWSLTRPVPELPVIRYGLTLPPDQGMLDVYEPSFALAPDGSWLVYVGPGGRDGQLWVKARDSYEAVPLTGTEGARAPVVSPDGAWIAFIAEGAVWKIPAGGGSAISLTDSANTNTPSLTWLDGGDLVFADPGWRLRRVPDVGGPSEIVWASESASYAMLPTPLPGGRGVLFKVCDAGCRSVSEAWVLDLESGDAHMLLPDVAAAWYAETGHLLYVRPDGGAFAAPFTLGPLAVRGAPVPVLGGVQVAQGIVPDFTVSRSGTLAMVTGVAGAGEGFEAVWVAVDGSITPVDSGWQVNPGTNTGWSISPDGRRVAIQEMTEAGRDIWIKELDRGPRSRLTFTEEGEQRPRWTPDGLSVLFLSNRGGDGYDLYRRRADGTGSAELLLDVEQSIQEARLSHDGKWLVFRTAGLAGITGTRDLWAMQLGVDSVPTPLLVEPYDEKAAALSPDSRWLAYESNETGRDEIFVRPFPNVNDGKWQISTNGGRMPLWAHSGRELYFMNIDREMVAVQVRTDPSFNRGERRMLFAIPEGIVTSTNYTPYDIHPDNRRFLMLRAVGSGDDDVSDGTMIMVENWYAELREKVGN